MTHFCLWEVISLGDIAISKFSRPRSKNDTKELRRNERIRVPSVRLIDENEQQMGVVDTRKALGMARDAGLDLVEIAANANPPVCKIMDYGKYKYAMSKKEHRAKAQSHQTELKEVRIKTPKIGDHDLMIKVGQAKKFLERGDRVQFSLRFRGRELAHIDEGDRVFDRVVEALQDISRVEARRREGRRITMMLTPLTKQQITQLQKQKEAQAAAAEAAAQANA